MRPVNNPLSESVKRSSGNLDPFYYFNSTNPQHVSSEQPPTVKQDLLAGRYNANLGFKSYAQTHYKFIF